MEERIKVLVAGFPNERAMTVAMAVCQAKDMELLNVGISEPGLANRHLKIACVYMEMFNLERKPLVFEQITPDVVVDCFSSEDEKENMENMDLFVQNEIRYIIVDEVNIDKLSANIKEILDKIRSIYQKSNVLESA